MVKGGNFDDVLLFGQTADALRAKGYTILLPTSPRGEFVGEDVRVKPKTENTRRTRKKV